MMLKTNHVLHRDAESAFPLFFARPMRGVVAEFFIVLKSNYLYYLMKTKT